MKNIIFFLLLFCTYSCTDYIPKPYGYYRIEMPAHDYKIFTNHFYSFQISSVACIESVTDTAAGEWFNIVYPVFDAKIYCSYLPVDRITLTEASEDSYKFVYRHVQKADAISKHTFENKEQGVYGIIYYVEGNVASPVQFVLTDSIKHFFRGALYFNCVPNQDSINPVLEYVQSDILELINSFHWTDK